MVVRAKYFNKVPGATRWYTPSTELFTTVRLQQVLVTNLGLQLESSTLKLPSSMRNKEATRRKDPVMISQEDHNRIEDEIARRSVLDFYEEEEDEDGMGADFSSDESDGDENSFDTEEDEVNEG